MFIIGVALVNPKSYSTRMGQLPVQVLWIFGLSRPMEACREERLYLWGAQVCPVVPSRLKWPRDVMKVERTTVLGVVSVLWSVFGGNVRFTCFWRHWTVPMCCTIVVRKVHVVAPYWLMHHLLRVFKWCISGLRTLVEYPHKLRSD